MLWSRSSCSVKCKWANISLQKCALFSARVRASTCFENSSTCFLFFGFQTLVRIESSASDCHHSQ
jgi:hypothetical protein